MSEVSELSGTEELGNPRIARINAEKGIRNYSLGLLREDKIKLFTEAFWRNIPSYIILNKPEVWIDTIIIGALKGSKDFQRDENSVSIVDLSPEDRILTVEKMLPVAEGQKYLLEKTQFFEISLENGLHIGIQYGSTIWDGDVGSVRCYLKDEASNEFIPAYSIRGVPWKKDDIFAFNIRNVQAWAGNDKFSAAISHIKTKGGNQSLLRDRQRLVDKLSRFMNAGLSIKDQNSERLTEQDIFLLLAITYFQKYGVREFQGTEHSKHHAVRAGKSLNFNYDDLFGKWFDGKRHESEGGGWSLKVGKGPCIPKFDDLPANARAIILKIITPS